MHLEVFDADHFHSDTALGECCILLTSEAAAFVDGERLTLVLTAAVPRESTEFEGVIPNATTEAERAQNASAEGVCVRVRVCVCVLFLPLCVPLYNL